MSSVPSSEYRLTYFNGRGAGEVIRLLFTVAKVPFVDDRLSIGLNPDGSFLRPEWDANKSNRELFPFAKIPVLSLNNGIRIPQSRAIERFIAKRTNLMGKTDVETALIDSLIEQLNDVKRPHNDARWKNDEGVSLKTFLTKDFIPFIELFEQFLERRKFSSSSSSSSSSPSSGPFFFGSAVSYADIAMYDFLWGLENGNDLEKKGVAEALKIAPKLAALKDAVANIPQLKEYVANRADTPF